MRQKSLNKLVDDYRSCHKPHLENELNYYRGINELADALMAAGLFWQNENEIHNHQYRINKESKKLFSRNLRNVSMGEVSTFADLYNRIFSCRVKGVGSLTIYDTALRLGAHLKMLPDGIYLHAGAYVGYKNLLGKVPIPQIIPYSQDIKELFNGLMPYEIENFLCIYKDDFKELGRVIKSKCSPVTPRGSVC